MKVLLEAPILTQSGYGEHSRLVFEALKKIEGTELYINPLNWAVPLGLVPSVHKLQVRYSLG